MNISDLKPGDYTVEAPGQQAPTGFGSPKKISDLKPDDYTVETPQATQEPSAMSKVVHGALKVAGYPGGIIRTGLASAAGIATGQPNTVNEQDAINALEGNAASSSEYLQRLGLDEGPSMQVLGHKVTLRDAEGFGLDVATDPLTHVAKLIEGAPYIKKLLNIPGEGVSAIGKALTKSAFPAAANDAADTIVEGIAGKLEGASPIGTQKQLAQKVVDTSSQIGNIRKGLYDQADALGVKIKPEDMDFSRAQGVIEDMKNSRSEDIRNMADVGQGIIDEFKQGGEATLADASRYKTELNTTIPKKFLQGQSTTLLPVAKRVKAAMAFDLKNMIIDAGNKGADGLGDAIDSVNSKWGPILDEVPNASKTATTQPSGKLGMLVDGAAIALGGPKAYAIKKAFDVANSSLVKSTAGAALRGAGDSGLATGLINQTAKKIAK